MWKDYLDSRISQLSNSTERADREWIRGLLLQGEMVEIGQTALDETSWIGRCTCGKCSDYSKEGLEVLQKRILNIISSYRDSRGER
jgi:hypothetical protein